MAITRVQGNARGTSTTSTISVTLAQTPISGNVLIAAIGVRGNKTVNSISQTGVTWTKQVGNFYQSYVDSEIWLGVVSSGASKSVTVNLSGTPTGAVADICEYSGIISNPLDKTATNGGSSGTATDTGTTPITTKADELWVGSIYASDYAQSSPTNGFTLLDGALFNFVMSVAYLEKIVSSTGAANSGTTLSGSAYWTGCIATFKGVTVYTQTISEILGMVDFIAPRADLKQTATDLLGMVDFIAPRADFKQTVIDQLSMLETLSTKATFHLTVTDILGMLDSVISLKHLYLTITETLSLVDSMATKSALKVAITEVLTMLDSLVPVKIKHIVITEILGLKDAIETRKHAGKIGDYPNHVQTGGSLQVPGYVGKKPDLPDDTITGGAP